MVHPDRFDCSLSLLNQGGFPLPRNFYVCTWLCKIYVRNVWKVLPSKRKSWTLVNFTFKRHTSFLASIIYASKIYVRINNLCWESVKSVPAYSKGLKSNSRKPRESDGKITMLDLGWKSFGSTIPSLPGFDWEIDRCSSNRDSIVSLLNISRLGRVGEGRSFWGPLFKLWPPNLATFPKLYVRTFLRYLVCMSILTLPWQPSLDGHVLQNSQFSLQTVQTYYMARVTHKLGYCSTFCMIIRSENSAGCMSICHKLSHHFWNQLRIVFFPLRCN